MSRRLLVGHQTRMMEAFLSALPKLFVLLLRINAAAAFPSDVEMAALKKFYQATDGAKWSINRGWLDGGSGANPNCPTTWAGVHCMDDVGAKRAHRQQHATTKLRRPGYVSCHYPLTYE